MDAGIRRFVFSATCAVYRIPRQMPITQNTLRRSGQSLRRIEAFLTSAVVDALRDLAAKHRRLHRQPAIGLVNGRDLPRCGDLELTQLARGFPE